MYSACYLGGGINNGFIKCAVLEMMGRFFRAVGTALPGLCAPVWSTQLYTIFHTLLQISVANLFHRSHNLLV